MIWSYVNHINGERQILFWFIFQLFLFVGSLVQRSGGNERDFYRGKRSFCLVNKSRHGKICIINCFTLVNINGRDES